MTFKTTWPAQHLQDLQHKSQAGWLFCSLLQVLLPTRIHVGVFILNCRRLIPALYEDFSSWNLGLSFLLVSLLRENSSFTVVSVLLFSTQYNRTLFLTLIHHFHWIVLYREKPSLRDWLASAYSLAWLLFSCL